MKYQSELIKEIVDTRGHEKSSIHYESECVESWIEEAKGAYPKLCDYQSEWLNYIIENPLGEFPYETVTDVTDATINNVVPYAYKSAILSGNTLVNLCDKTKSVFSLDGNKNSWQNVLLNTNPTQLTVINYTDKTIKFTTHNRTTNEWVSTNGVKANSKSLVNCGTDKYLKDIYGAYGDGWSNTEEDRNILKNGILVLEGDHTQEDVPYFEGMQSVKMPVLTTTGKNLFDISKEQKNITINVDNGNVDIKTNDRNTSDFIKVIPNAIYKCNVTMSRMAYYDKNKQFISLNTSVSQPITIPTSCNFVKFSYDNALTNIQFEQGSIATSYEPYKANILTVNEEVELRGIGEVQDTLDCLTGEMTERISKIILDGTQSSVTYNSQYSNDDYYSFIFDMTNDGFEKAPSSPIAISCPIPFQQNKMFAWTTAKEFVLLGSDGNTLLVKLLKSKLNNDNSISSLNTYLASNPITINYPLKTESVKTVDLTITNQKGESLSKMTPIEGTMHIHSDGTPLKPSITMEIPVEATTQNLASFIKEE